MQGHQKSHTLLIDVQNGTVALKTSVAVSYIAKHAFSMQPSNSAPRHLPRGGKMYLHTDLYVNFITALFIA